MFARAMQFALNKFSFVKTGWTKWINKIFSPIFPAMETLDISILQIGFTRPWTLFTTPRATFGENIKKEVPVTGRGIISGVW